MLAIGLDDVDFWDERLPQQFGRQVPRSISSSSVSDSRGKAEFAIRQTIDWVAPGDRCLAEEAREITGHMGVIPHASLLIWKSSFRPGGERDSVKMWGRHYFGLGMRFVEAMDQGSHFLYARSEPGEVVRGTERLTKAKWCAVQGNVEGQKVTVAMFDLSSKARREVTWFTMHAPFAYLSATLGLAAEPLIVRADQPVTLHVAIAAWDGSVGADEIDTAYQRCLEMR
jgi:hypothetical protein